MCSSTTGVLELAFLMLVCMNSISSWFLFVFIVNDNCRWIMCVGWLVDGLGRRFGGGSKAKKAVNYCKMGCEASCLFLPTLELVYFVCDIGFGMY